jgi:hypothetical protein
MSFFTSRCDLLQNEQRRTAAGFFGSSAAFTRLKIILGTLGRRTSQSSAAAPAKPVLSAAARCSAADF